MGLTRKLWSYFALSCIILCRVLTRISYRLNTTRSLLNDTPAHSRLLLNGHKTRPVAVLKQTELLVRLELVDNGLESAQIFNIEGLVYATPVGFAIAQRLDSN